MRVIKSFNIFVSNEGVADKYAEKEFNIPDKTGIVRNTLTSNLYKDDSYCKFKDQKGQIITIYKNPPNLSNINPNVRAICDIEGNIFIADINGIFNHSYMGYEIFTDVNIYNMLDKYVLLVRIGNTNGFALSDSSFIYGEDEPENNKNVRSILITTMHKNPQFVYYDNAEWRINKNSFPISEGIADKYAESESHMKHPHADFENKYRKIKNIENNEEIISLTVEDNQFDVIKNPKSFKSILINARGIIDNNGNLYVSMQPKIHSIILKGLINSQLIDEHPKWVSELPTQFITVQRYKDTNIFKLGESNLSMYDDDKRKRMERVYNITLPDRDTAESVYQTYLDKAKKINRSWNFVNEPYL